MLNVDPLKNLLEEIALEIYNHLGAGFDEHIYQGAFAYELRQRGLRYQREVNIEIFYKGIPLGLDRPDFIIRPCKVEEFCVENPVLIELKAVDKLNENHKNQLITYLVSIVHSPDEELRSCKYGYLINFPKKNMTKPEIVFLP